MRRCHRLGSLVLWIERLRAGAGFRADAWKAGARVGTLACAAMLAIALPMAAIAGSGDYEHRDDEEDQGPPFFGEAMDLGRYGPLEGVRVKAAVKGTAVSIVAETDADGRFRMSGLGKGIGVDQVELSCAKDGYTTAGVMSRAAGSAYNAPVTVECLMARK